MRQTQIQNKILHSLPSNPSGRLLLAPRIGKSKLVIEIIKRNNPKSILWVTPSSLLANQDIPNEFKKWGASNFLPNLTTCTWAYLPKMKGNFDLVILDEEQKITSNNIQPLLNKDIIYNNILSMTGSPTKDGEKNMLYDLLKLKILYQIDVEDAVKLNVLSDYRINVIRIPMGKEKNVNIKGRTKSFVTSEIKNYEYLSSLVSNAVGKKKLFSSLLRMRFIHNSPSKLAIAKKLLAKLEGRKLVFCANIEQAETLSPNSYHSKTDAYDLKKFTNNQIDTITMVNAGGIGFTYKDIDHLVIVQVNSDRNGDILQKISRSLLKQKDYTATIWILVLAGTSDERWVQSVLENFDDTKIHYYNSQILFYDEPRTD